MIPSRGRVRGLSTLLHCMHKLASGKHKITYAVSCDDDDPQTVDFCRAIRKFLPVAFKLNNFRPSSIGGMFNELALLAPAQVYTTMCDDLLVLSHEWDETIAAWTQAHPYHITHWKNMYPTETLYAIVTERWRAAAGGIYTDHYPFWFDDSVLLELWALTTSIDHAATAIDVFLYDKPQTETLRMRDISFWGLFYEVTRPLRVKKAYEIAKKLGLPDPLHAAALGKALTRQQDTLKIQLKEMQKIENTQGDPRPPDAAYIETKRRAKVLMAKILMEDTNELPTNV